MFFVTFIFEIKFFTDSKVQTKLNRRSQQSLCGFMWPTGLSSKERNIPKTLQRENGKHCRDWWEVLLSSISCFYSFWVPVFYSWNTVFKKGKLVRYQMFCAEIWTDQQCNMVAFNFEMFSLYLERKNRMNPHEEKHVVPLRLWSSSICQNKDCSLPLQKLFDNL